MPSASIGPGWYSWLYSATTIRVSPFTLPPTHRPEAKTAVRPDPFRNSKPELPVGISQANEPWFVTNMEMLFTSIEILFTSLAARGRKPGFRPSAGPAWAKTRAAIIDISIAPRFILLSLVG